MQMAAFQIIAIQMMSANMLDDFFNRAVLAGIGLAIIVGPLGCLIIWRQMAFFGDTLAHAALLGIALAILADLSPMIGVPFVTLATCVALLAAKHSQRLSSDTILAILAHCQKLAVRDGVRILYAQIRTQHPHRQSCALPCKM